MAATRRATERHRVSQDAALAGMLALLVDERELRTKDDKTARKTEILLAQAGLSVEDIVALTGKKPDAVRKTIQRGQVK